MLAPQTPAAEPAQPRLQTEAEGLANLLMDLGITPAAVIAPQELLLFEVHGEARSGAVDVARQAAWRFRDDAEFRDDMISSVATFGHLLADAPSFDAELKTASAVHLCNVLANAGLFTFFATTVNGKPEIGFFLVGDRQLPNAHLLMRLMRDRFASEEAFARDLKAYMEGINAVYQHALKNPSKAA